MSIGVSEETAYADACKIEHDISDETFDKIKAHIGNILPANNEESIKKPQIAAFFRIITGIL